MATQVLVAPITGAGEHHDAAAGDIQALRKIGHRRHRVRVVAVVEQHLERMLVEHIHAPGRLEERRVEGAQTLADRIELDAERKCHRGGEHRVLHVVGRASLERRGNQMRPEQRDMAAPVVERDHLSVDARLERAGAAAGADVLAHQACCGFIVT